MNTINKTDLNKRLYSAAYEGSLNKVKQCLEEGADANFQNILGNTAAHVACARGRDDILEALITAGCDINIRNKENNQAIHFACMDENKVPDQKSNRLGVVKNLLSMKADPNSEGSYQYTPLHYLAFNQNFDPRNVIELLVKSGANIDSRNKWQLTPLHMSAGECLLNNSRVLLNNGADHTLISGGGYSVLGWGFEAVNKYTIDIMSSVINPDNYKKIPIKYKIMLEDFVCLKEKIDTSSYDRQKVNLPLDVIVASVLKDKAEREFAKALEQHEQSKLVEKLRLEKALLVKERVKSKKLNNSIEC